VWHHHHHRRFFGAAATAKGLSQKYLQNNGRLICRDPIPITIPILIGIRIPISRPTSWLVDYVSF